MEKLLDADLAAEEADRAAEEAGSHTLPFLVRQPRAPDIDRDVA